ncbi:ubiquitin ligase complex subunit HRD3 [Aspergillus foveolatus]|uniref:ubiquitin ligase complex subunit HRD3 n=1 Tax=Aspergillus foveolatus TaxID=210207 RepID=UPI003CCE0A87
MKNLWLWHFLPLVLLFLCTFALDIHNEYPLSDVTRGPPHPSGDTSNSDAPPNEHVQYALRILREAKIPVVPSAGKPSGFIGYTWYYAQEAFRILFMNGPPSSSGAQRKIHPSIARAVDALKIAAVEDHDPDAMFLLAEMNFYGNFSHPQDFKQAFHWYKRLASWDGNSTAQYMLGFMYATGIGGGVERDQAKALLYHAFAAEAGNTRSEMTLAYRHHAGIGTPRNCDEATYYYKQVADKAIDYYRSGPPGGHSMVRESYRWADEEGGVYGEGASASSSGPSALRDGSSSTEASLEDVLEYLDLMSRKGEVKATFSLGKMHYEGTKGLPKNYKKALKYFKQVTKRYWNKDNSLNPNHPAGIEKLASKAAGHVGLMYLRGEGVEQNFETAYTWFKLGLANGDALCQHQIGLMYLHGYGVQQDAFKASSYFKAAADQDYPAAETRLGALFLDQGDVATATKYFELAARWGWMEAFYYLAELANNGVGRQRHCGLAASYYKMVAEKAEAIHSSFTEANAAYESGDKERAFIPMLMAAEQGYEHAQANVAFILDEQRSLLPLEKFLPGLRKSRSPLLKNAALALIQWTRSAKQANVDSLLKMGDYYLSGNGIDIDTEKASTCYHTAAEAHFSAQAYWNLGWMHENGIAVEQDFHMAKRYYDLALETSSEAYLPVKLSLLKLRARSAWNRLTNGKVNSIREDDEPKPRRTFSEWIAAFIENDEEEEANYRAQLYKHGEEDDDDILSSSEHHRLDDHEDGYYDDLELDIDESILEGLIILSLAATLMVLVYLRQQRNNRQRPNDDQGANAAGQANANNRGFFPRPGDPEFAQWMAGGLRFRHPPSAEYVPPFHLHITAKMASSIPNGKRRRLDQATTALSKPFKSPLRRPTPAVKDEVASPKTEGMATTSSFTKTNTPDEQDGSTALPISSSKNALPIPPPTRKRTLPGQGLTPARKPVPSDPEVLDLQKRQRELQSRLSSLRSDLDTVQQALRIESSSSDEELEALIMKWKKVSQDAAEEVFSGAQERISRMGGVKAWRERMNNNDARWEQEEMENWFGNVDAGALDMDEDELQARKAELREEMERKNVKESSDGSEEFTMDTMLKMLNIELTTIGYDKANQRWITG